MTKRMNYLLLALITCAAGFVSCVKEDAPKTDESKTIQVTVSLGDAVKGFTDLEGIKWEVGDQIKYAGGVELTSQPLTAEQISADGHKASFTFDATLIAADRTGWFVSTKCHSSNYTEVEYTLGKDNGNLFTQDVAGEMNSRYLFLHSGTSTINITKDVTPSFKMDIAGSIFRVIPYTTTYNDEKVLSVKFESNDKVVGTVGYDRGAGTYKSVTEVNAPNGWKAYTFVKVDLGTAFSLNGVTCAENSKGIYLPVAATKADATLNGYKYVVETDKATYTFDAMGEKLAVGENVVKNVFLNLDKGVRTTESGYLKYDGALNLSPIPAGGCTDQDAGYWQALTSADGNDPWTVRINSENAFFYSGVQFSYKDATSKEPVDWISVTYGGSDLCHWRVTAQPNTGEARSVIVTATYPDVKGYTVIPESKTKEWTFTQSAAGAAKLVEYASVSLPAFREFESSAQDKVNVGYCLLKIDGAEMRDWADANSIYARSKFVYVSEANYTAKNFTTDVDWLSCVYANNGTSITDCVWLVSAAENTGEERTAYVVCVFPEDKGYSFPEPRALKVTQKAGYTVKATLSNVYAETVPAAGATITAAKLALTVNGAAQEDVAAALSTYGITVSADNGATASVALNGTVTLTVPENKYKNGGVTYTLTVKNNSGTTLASATINQAEGTEEQKGNAYSYTITLGAHTDGGVIGFPTSFDDKGVYFRFSDVKVNGETVELTDEIVNELIAYAFVPSDDRPAEGYNSYNYVDAGQIYIKATVENSSQIAFAPCTTADSKGYCCTINLMNSDGTKNRSIFYFVP